MPILPSSILFSKYCNFLLNQNQACNGQNTKLKASKQLAINLRAKSWQLCPVLIIQSIVVPLQQNRTGCTILGNVLFADEPSGLSKLLNDTSSNTSPLLICFFLSHPLQSTPSPVRCVRHSGRGAASLFPLTLFNFSHREDPSV